MIAPDRLVDSAPVGEVEIALRTAEGTLLPPQRVTFVRRADAGYSDALVAVTYARQAGKTYARSLAIPLSDGQPVPARLILGARDLDTRRFRDLPARIVGWAARPELGRPTGIALSGDQRNGDPDYVAEALAEARARANGLEALAQASEAQEDDVTVVGESDLDPGAAIDWLLHSGQPAATSSDPERRPEPTPEMAARWARRKYALGIIDRHGDDVEPEDRVLLARPIADIRRDHQAEAVSALLRTSRAYQRTLETAMERWETGVSQPARVTWTERAIGGLRILIEMTGAAAAAAAGTLGLGTAMAVSAAAVAVGQAYGAIVDASRGDDEKTLRGIYHRACQLINDPIFEAAVEHGVVAVQSRAEADAFRASLGALDIQIREAIYVVQSAAGLEPTPLQFDDTVSLPMPRLSWRSMIG